MPGVRTDDIGLVSSVSHLLGNRDVAGVKTTGIIPLADLVALMVGTAPLSGLLENRLSDHGAGIGFGVAEQELTMAGASIDTTTALIPAKAIGLAVTTRVTQAVTGATSFSVGISGDTSRFATGLAVALNSPNVGVANPVAYAAATAIRLTSSGGSFSGGKVRVAVFYITFTAPTS